MVQDSSSKVLQTKGITLIEVVIGVSILSLVVVMVLFSMTLFLSSRSAIMDKTKSLYLAEEGLEMVRYLRDEQWSQVRSKTPYVSHYLSTSGSAISIVSTPEIIDGRFLRQFSIQPVSRQNTTEDLVASTSASKHGDDHSMYVVVRVGTDSGTTTLKTFLGDIF